MSGLVFGYSTDTVPEPRRRVMQRAKRDSKTQGEWHSRNRAIQVARHHHRHETHQKRSPAPRPDFLAYAPNAPNRSALGLQNARTAVPHPGRKGPAGGTIVYDISAHTAYLPNGDVIDMHSGVGKGVYDNPDNTHLKMRGATPPGDYSLSERGMFFGVEALRLNPLSGTEMHGRGGILFHTPLLRGHMNPSDPEYGASNGCGSSPQHYKVLQAYRDGCTRAKVVKSGGAEWAQKLNGHQYARGPESPRQEQRSGRAGVESRPHGTHHPHGGPPVAAKPAAAKDLFAVLFGPH